MSHASVVSSVCARMPCRSRSATSPGKPSSGTAGLDGTDVRSVAAYVRASLAVNPRRAYETDLTLFTTWGGSIPATDHAVATYLADHAGKLSVATLVRRLASLSKAHEASGLRNPTRSPLVSATLRGIRRTHGSAQSQAKPLLLEDLFRVLSLMGEETRDMRDRALLLIGSAGGFRRSELIGINREDVESVRHEVIITVRRSKTDPLGLGREIAIPLGRTRNCPVSALEGWLSASDRGEAAFFRRVDRHHQILSGRLGPASVSAVVKERAAAAGFDPSDFSGHSLRAGFATSAARAGASSWKIRGQTGHKSDAMVGPYIRDGDLFHDNPHGTSTVTQTTRRVWSSIARGTRSSHSQMARCHVVTTYP